MDYQGEMVRDGFCYLEAARWHDGALWFSDIGNRKIHRMTPDGTVSFVAEVPETPSGLGWAPDGALLLISMEDSGLRRMEPSGEIRLAHALANHVFHANDMAVDSEGRAYVTQFGFDLFGGKPPAGCSLLLVQPDGQMILCGEGLVFPNGVGISKDGRTLVTAESFSGRLTAFDRAADGTLSGQRTIAHFDQPEDVLDGLCIDAELGVWVAAPMRGEFWRIVEGKGITDRVRPAPGAGTYCVDCMLGGPDMRTLYLLVADTTVERLGNNWDSTASIQQVRVAVPGF